jgi:hypothetical protein
MRPPILSARHRRPGSKFQADCVSANIKDQSAAASNDGNHRASVSQPTFLNGLSQKAARRPGTTGRAIGGGTPQMPLCRQPEFGANGQRREVFLARGPA